MSKKKKETIIRIDDSLITDIKQLIYESKQKVAIAINSTITILYWNIGKRINKDILKNKRADYGKVILPTVSAKLQSEFGRGFSHQNLYRMIKFHSYFSDEQILPTLSVKLSWSHIIELLNIEDKLKREFYLTICMESNWSVRRFRERKDSMLFERTALSKKPDKLLVDEIKSAKSGKLSANFLLKDPYFFDFLELNDRYLEKDLEDAILRELEQFLLELGVGFTFVERQKRIQIDGDDFYIDLLFYNRKLKRLIVIELKLGDFKASYKGQMELYLRWLAKYETEEEENPPLGIILCSGKKEQQIELLELDRSGIHVAEYLTTLPSKEVLKRKLDQAIQNAKSKALISSRKDEKEKKD